MQQVVVGLLGSMVSFLVYSSTEAYIEDDDDFVSSVAQGQVVFTYFAALAVYTSDVSDQKRDIFSSTSFGVVLIIIFFASFIVAVWVILLDVFGYSSLLDVYNEVIKRCYNVKTSPSDEAVIDDDDDDTERPSSASSGASVDVTNDKNQEEKLVDDIELNEAQKEKTIELTIDESSTNEERLSG